VICSLQLQEVRDMTKTVFERAEEHFAEPMHKVSRATAAMAEALEDGIHAAKRVGKTGSEAAEEFLEDARERVKRHPAGTIAAAFGLGFLFGAIFDWMVRRK
jgi:ElaB/YqjD/DUF883 family membrane-anchored ribosome-binding protein